MVHDLRLAVRSLARQRSFTLAALATLAIGIAATTAMFAVVYGVLLRPLPYPDADRLVQLSEVVPGGTPAISGPMISTISIHAWEPHRRTVGPIAHFGGGSVTVGFDTPQPLVRGNVAPHFFDVTGVRPVAGRFFVEQDAAAGAAPASARAAGARAGAASAAGSSALATAPSDSSGGRTRNTASHLAQRSRTPSGRSFSFSIR